MAEKNFSNLTPKQARILEFIEQCIGQEGRPPSFREIAKHFGYSAVGTVEDHVKALIKKGLLQKEEGSFHGLRLSYQAPSQSVPILGQVPAGNPIEAIEDTVGSLSFSTSKNRGDIFALKVKGDSMIEAGILEGDYVIVRKQSDAENGEIVVASIDGESTVKRLEKKKGRIRLIPENPRYEPIELQAGRENAIQGKVISLQRFY